MESDERPSRYPYLISVRGGRPVPARKDGHYYVCAYQVFLGLWWSPREVKVLEYDPHRDFYREQRQARDAAQRGAEPDAGPAASEGSATAAPDAVSMDVGAWERVDSPGPRHPTPPPAGCAPYAARRAWGL